MRYRALLLAADPKEKTQQGFATSFQEIERWASDTLERVQPPFDKTAYIRIEEQTYTLLKSIPHPQKTV